MDIEMVLFQLAHAAMCGGDLSARAWALGPPRRVRNDFLLGEQFPWPSDLPPLPESLRGLLSWRRFGENVVVKLPVAEIHHWSAVAAQTRAAADGTIVMGPLRFGEQGVTDARGGWVARDVSDWLLIEADVLWRRCGGRGGEVRLEGPLAPFGPCEPPTEEEADAMGVGTVLCAKEDGRLRFSVKLEQMQWVSCTCPGQPSDEALLAAWRQAAYYGQISGRPHRRGTAARSSVRTWRRPPMASLLERLDVVLGTVAPAILASYGPPASDEDLRRLEALMGVALPLGLQQLWRHTNGTREYFWKVGALQEVERSPSHLYTETSLPGVHWARSPQQCVEGLIQLMSDGYDGLYIDVPGRIGPPGSVFTWAYEEGRLELTHGCLEDWLEGYVMELERGLWVDGEYGLVLLDDEEGERASQAIQEIVGTGYPLTLDYGEGRWHLMRPEALQSDTGVVGHVTALMQSDPLGIQLAAEARRALVLADGSCAPGPLGVLCDWLAEREILVGPVLLARLVTEGASPLGLP
jgi:hypothetical protein